MCWIINNAEEIINLVSHDLLCDVITGILFLPFGIYFILFIIFFLIDGVEGVEDLNRILKMMVEEKVNNLVKILKKKKIRSSGEK